MSEQKTEKKNLIFKVNIGTIGLDLITLPQKIDKYIKSKYKSKYFLNIIETDKNDNYIFKYKLLRNSKPGAVAR